MSMSKSPDSKKAAQEERDWVMAVQGNKKLQIKFAQQNPVLEAVREIPLDWYKKAAEEGDKEAQYEYAFILFDGVRGARKDETEAMEWYQKAAMQEHETAQKSFLKYFKVKKDTQWYRDSVAQMHLTPKKLFLACVEAKAKIQSKIKNYNGDTHFQLACYAAKKASRRKDEKYEDDEQKGLFSEEEALEIKWLCGAVRKKHEKAQLRLAEKYKNNAGLANLINDEELLDESTEKYISHAFYLHRNDNISEKEFGELLYTLGCRYVEGQQGLPKKIATGFELLKAAIHECGHVEAMLKLAAMYAAGIAPRKHGEGREEDGHYETYYLFAAAEGGLEEARIEIVRMWLDGRAFPPHYNHLSLIQEWLRLDGEALRYWDIPKSMEYELSRIYKLVKEGKDEEETKAEQRKWKIYWLKRALMGNSEGTLEERYSQAQYELSQCFPKRYDSYNNLFLFWLQKAAENGHPQAQYELGQSYFPSNHPHKWLKKAAENGHLEAQYKLGEYYEMMEDTRDTSKLTWYRKAADQGHEGAKRALESMRKATQALIVQFKDEGVAGARAAGTAEPGSTSSTAEMGENFSSSSSSLPAATLK